ncbi:Hypothetical protein SMAX5B_019022 [Scophthalmus maximus]|uniref:Uncharacterized protein n=1 Tax=Scophthalmus maximus TaxID=52904 RepID=A0A2U9C8L3_SCOMX|nr:Hypothetical protein SMAX5B_019022 [Scophthalmus maximus]
MFHPTPPVSTDASAATARPTVLCGDSWALPLRDVHRAVDAGGARTVSRSDHSDCGQLAVASVERRLLPLR